MNVVVSSVTQTDLQQLRACLGICRSCVDTTTPTAVHYTGLTDLVLALEIAVAMIETRCQHVVDRLSYCAKVFALVVRAWADEGSERCQACIRICGEVLEGWARPQVQSEV